MTDYRKIDVDCQCGEHLFEYRKRGKGRLIKCFLDEIIDSPLELTGLPLGTRIFCPGCQKRIGTVQMVSGRPAVKLNQGAIKPVRL